MTVNIRNFVSWIGQLIRGGTTGSVLFIGENGELKQDNANLFWDDSNNRLGIGTSTPTYTVDIRVASINALAIGPTTNTTSGIRISDGRAQIYYDASSSALIMKADTGKGIELWVNGGKQAFFDINSNFVIGTSAANGSASLEIQSTTKGMLFPRMTTVQKAAISSPASGLVVYDSTLNKLCVYGAAGWETVTSV